MCSSGRFNALLVLVSLALVLGVCIQAGMHFGSNPDDRWTHTESWYYQNITFFSNDTYLDEKPLNCTRERWSIYFTIQSPAADSVSRALLAAYSKLKVGEQVTLKVESFCYLAPMHYDSWHFFSILCYFAAALCVLAVALMILYVVCNPEDGSCLLFPFYGARILGGLSLLVCLLYLLIFVSGPKDTAYILAAVGFSVTIPVSLFIGCCLFRSTVMWIQTTRYRYKGGPRHGEMFTSKNELGSVYCMSWSCCEEGPAYQAVND